MIAATFTGCQPQMLEDTLARGSEQNYLPQLFMMVKQGKESYHTADMLDGLLDASSFIENTPASAEAMDHSLTCGT